MLCNACDVAVCADRGCSSSTWMHGLTGRAFVPALEAKEVECIASHIMDWCLVVGSDNHTPFFFFPVPIKGICCLKHGFIPQHERCLAAHLTLLKPECDLAVLVAMRDGFTATGMSVSM